MKLILGALFLLTPLFVFSAVGFTQDSVWLSHTPVIEGETVSIYAALTNGAKENLTGTAYFRDNGVAIGSLSISLSQGEARIISTRWSPKEGKHTLAVEIASSSVSLPKNTQTLTVTVESKEYHPPANVGGVGSAAGVAFSDSSGIQEKIGSISPAAESVTRPIFTTVDGWRLGGANFLATHTDSARAKVESIAAEKKTLAEENTPESQTKSRKLTVSHILYTILLYIYEALQTLVAKAAFFYPLIVVLLFFLLWKIVRRIRRPTRDY